MSDQARTRVMLVDDHLLIREAIRQILDREPDIEVVGEAGSGEELLELIDRLCPDVVLMDVRMPGIDGIEATRRLRSTHPPIRVLVLSAYPDFAAEALRAGAAGYVVKNGGSRQLVAALHSVARGLTVIDGELVTTLPLGIGGEPDRRRALLSSREGEILRLIAGGLTNRAIARQMGIAPRTADQHVHNIFIKVGARSRAEAVRYAIEHELVTSANA